MSDPDPTPFDITHSEEDDLTDIEQYIGEDAEDPFPETWPTRKDDE